MAISNGAATIALCVMMLLGPVLGVIVGHNLKAAADKVVAQAQVVQKDCNIRITTNVTVTAPPASISVQMAAGTVHAGMNI